jgi:hypothetical protein
MGIDKTGKKESRSRSALSAAAASLLCVIVTAYLASRHRHTVSIYAVMLIFVPLAIQLYGQFQRARGIVHSTESVSAKSKEVVFDLLAWGATNNLLLLVYIAALLRRIDGFF